MEAKRRRLDAPAGVASLGVFSRISMRTVDTVLNRVRANPGCLEASQKSYKIALRAEKNKLRKELEIVIDVPLTKGTTFSWGMLDPAGLMQWYCKESKEYAGKINRARQRYPVGRWRLVLYEDEIQPGNAFLNRRKLHAWYFCFREFDLEFYETSSWLCFAVLQSSLVASVQGGFSCVTKLVHQVLFTRKTPNFAAGVGVLCPMPFLVRADLEDNQDADAKKYKWDIKGHGGLKPCMHCSNCFMKAHDAANSHADFVDITDLDWDRVKNHQVSDQQIWDAQDELLALLDVRGSGPRRKQLEMAYGMNTNKHGLLACKELRSWVKPSRSSYDPMHCLFSNGIAELEVNLVCRALGKLKFDFRKIEAFVNMGWKPTKHLQFSKDGVKGMASECMRAVPLLRHFLNKLVKPFGVLVNEVAAFDALADVVAQFQKMKLSSTISDAEADKLQALMARHFHAFKIAYGSEEVLPKHHYTMHLPTQMKRLGLIVDCYVCERKNKLPKSVVEFYFGANYKGLLELNVVTSMNLQQLDEMHRAPVPGQLIEPSETNGEFRVSNSARLFNVGTIQAGQVFLSNGACFILKACLSNDAAGLILLARKYVFSTTDGHPAAKVWRDSGEHVCFTTDESCMCNSIRVFSPGGSKRLQGFLI